MPHLFNRPGEILAALLSLAALLAALTAAVTTAPLPVALRWLAPTAIIVLLGWVWRLQRLTAAFCTTLGDTAHRMTAGEQALRMPMHWPRGLLPAAAAFNALSDFFSGRAAGLQQRIEDYQIVIDNLPMRIFSKNRDLNFQIVNAGYAAMFKTTPPDMYGKNLLAFFPRETADKNAEDDMRIITSGTPELLDEYLLFEGGGKRTLRTHKAPLRDRTGATIGLLGVFWDITEQKQVEKSLKFSLDIFQQMNTSSDMDLVQTALEHTVSLTDSKIGFFHLVNPDQKTVHLYHWSRGADRSCGVQPGFDKHYPVDQAGVWADCIREKRIVVHNDFSAVTGRKGLPRGHVPIVREVLIPIIDGDKVVAVLGVGNKRRDYTQAEVDHAAYMGRNLWTILRRKAAEEALAEQKQMLEKANQELIFRNQELNDFTYIASHDLQEPLRKISAFSSLLKTDLGDRLSEDASENLDFLVDSAQRMQALVDALLALSRSGTRELARTPVSLEACADDALAIFRDTISAAHIEIVRDVLPEVLGDRVLLGQLYQNLIGNAVKFRSLTAPRIYLTVVHTGKEWVLGVKDNGIGIAAQYADQIFTPFKRLHGRGQYPGTGIGLAICRKVAERHGGRIWVESEPGRGSHFKFTLPDKKEETP